MLATVVFVLNVTITYIMSYHNELEFVIACLVFCAICRISLCGRRLLHPKEINISRLFILSGILKVYLDRRYYGMPEG